jgi:hypothetical protein
VGGGVFRATEAALGVAAGELFAALPAGLPRAAGRAAGDVAALEARAAEARAELDVVAALAPVRLGDADVLARRARAAARRRAWRTASRRWRDPARPPAPARRLERPGAAHHPHARRAACSARR